VLRYQHRLSGPILDRIDLYSSVHEVEHDKLLTGAVDPKADKVVLKQVEKARKLQAKRYAGSSKLNADMTNADIKKYGRLETEADALLNTAAKRFNVSARSYMRTIKVARTIADLDDSPSVTSTHISEALAYRRQTYKG
jgi:magnesium chelatase family protein